MACSVNIVSTGARTPLGLQSAPSAAAVRAGISGVIEHPFLVDHRGSPVLGALDRKLDPRLVGLPRLLALAESALREVCTPLNDAPESYRRVPLYLALPERRPGFTAEDAQRIQNLLEQIRGLSVKFSTVTAFPQGHAAGFVALKAATDQMQQRDCEVCLVGGVDSYFQSDTLGWLDKNRQLISSGSRSGFVPGEGAGFCLMMTDNVCERLNLAALVSVRAVVISKETKLIKTSEVCLGEGITEAVREVCVDLSLSESKISDVICDINGERYRGEEWGFACLRLSHYFNDPTAYCSPADCWGDLGAASGPLLAMLACQTSARGYTKGSRTLLWASSEGGLRAAAMLHTIGST